ncbi:MAG: aconitase X catalytic domain-containing protein [Methanobacteriota archaeon]
MHLTKKQEATLAGERGEVLQRSMMLLARLGDIYGADRMLPVNSVQVAGVSYKSIGDPGLDFLEDYAKKGARVKALTYLNPAGMDMEDWQALGFPKDFAVKQKRIMAAFAQMGIVTSATCTPYLAGNLPRFREHIAWSESSAVSFANSVIGARSNREGGPSALAAALCGVTPNYGLHLDENRKPNYIVKVEAAMDGMSDYGALGYHVGKIVKNKVPYFVGLPESDTDMLKALGAAMAASGAVGVYHVENQTPEAHLHKTDGLEAIHFGKKEMDEAYAKLNTGAKADIAILGCPHASLREMIALAAKLRGRKVKKALWICTARATKDTAVQMGIVAEIEKAGGKVVADTCMVVSPIEDMGYKTTGVNSGKAGNYLPGFCKQSVVYRNIDDLVKEVTE